MTILQKGKQSTSLRMQYTGGMSEKFTPNQEKLNPLVKTIQRVREQINEQRAFVLLDDIYMFDKQLKIDVTTRFGSTRLLQQVAAWQALVGGTIEPEETITSEQKAFVEEQIGQLIQVLESKLS
jgi:hypothetical protein